ncbi:cytoskeleton-associated protein 5 [Streptomyces lydicamycinicus]|uniref:Cytoskeleton-associated protein 5 n=1 Tax=Streptomyces lydicamycinicus TaxID=1546107 RepID=A0A0N7YLJ9_9ACTN|nr:cytoskeleton-associated protein 5 [Streptomyces lydicamycinicus]
MWGVGLVAAPLGRGGLSLVVAPLGREGLPRAVAPLGRGGPPLAGGAAVRARHWRLPLRGPFIVLPDVSM